MDKAAAWLLLWLTPLGAAHGHHNILHVGSIYGTPTSFASQLSVHVSFADDCPVNQSLGTQLAQAAIDDSLILPTATDDPPRQWFLMAGVGCLKHSGGVVWIYMIETYFRCITWPIGLSVTEGGDIGYGYAGKKVIETALAEEVTTLLRKRINHFTKANMHHPPMHTPTCMGPLVEPIERATLEVALINSPPDSED